MSLAPIAEQVFSPTNANPNFAIEEMENELASPCPAFTKSLKTADLEYHN